MTGIPDFGGQVIAPGDSEYDEARKLNNAMWDKRPALIARCASTADVVAAVKYGHTAGLNTAVRCGGHNGAGLGSVDDGLVIELSGLKTVDVDPKARTVRVGRRLRLGRGRQRDGQARSGDAERDHLDDGRRRIDARRRHRPPDAQVRPVDRQHPRGRSGARRRQRRHRQRERERRPVLGHPRRRRKLRHRHVLPVPPARRPRSRCRSHLLGRRPGRRGDVRLPRLHSGCAA